MHKKATAAMNSAQAPAIDLEALDAAMRLMRRRRSVRRYAAQAVPAEVLEHLLTCATLAPSAHNRQPWRFAVVQSLEHKAGLARAMGEQLRRDRQQDGDDAALVEADVTRSFERITGAPVVLLVATSLEHMDAYTDERRRNAEATMALQSTAMAVQNLMLAAAAAGIGTCWMCAPLFCPDVARAALGLPPHWQAQGLVTLGLPAGEARTRERRPLTQVVLREQDA